MAGCRSLSIQNDQRNQFGRVILERIRDCRINDLIHERDLGIRHTRFIWYLGTAGKRGTPITCYVGELIIR